MTQTHKVLNYLSQQPHINKFRAQGELNVNDLRKCISNIRQWGYEIVKRSATNWNGQRYTNYGLTPEGRTKARAYMVTFKEAEEAVSGS